MNGPIILSEAEIQQSLEEIGWRKIIDAVTENTTEGSKKNSVSQLIYNHINKGEK